MFRRLRDRISESLTNVDDSVDKVEVNILEVLDQIEEMLREGVSFSVEVAGHLIPVKIIMEPIDEKTGDV
ncbi:hypothetical protein LCGC14_2758610 [marine sediment metagenome]|uniref:Uncharacterized protein n=1 Tax=marine sediment metagenome TaxID=412755 RepID=A0A0F8YZR2_9ZZZZ